MFFYRMKATCWAKKITYFALPISFWGAISTDVESTSLEFLITGKLLNPTKSSTMRKMSNQFHQNFDINKYRNQNLIRRHHAMITVANKHVQWGNVHIFYNIHFSPKYSKYFHNFVTVLNKCFFLKRPIRVLINTWIWTLISMNIRVSNFSISTNLQVFKGEKLRIVIWHIFRGWDHSENTS